MAAVYGCGCAVCAGCFAEGGGGGKAEEPGSFHVVWRCGDGWILGDRAGHLLWAGVSHGQRSLPGVESAFAGLRGRWGVSVDEAVRLRGLRDAPPAGYGSCG